MKITTTNTILYCRHWRETVAFYRDLLKLPVLSERDWFVEFELTPDSRLSVADESRASVKSSGGEGLTLSLRIIGLDDHHAGLLAASLNPTAIKTLWGSRVFYLRDPEGNRLEFWQ